MAKLAKGCVSYSSLDERGCSLAEIMKSLGLKPLTKKSERKLRDRLGFAMARWDAPYPPFVVKDIVRLLDKRAECLKQVEKLGTIARGGFAREDEIVVGGELVQILASDPAIGSVERAHAYLKDFSAKAHTLASACGTAARKLRARKGKAGKPPLDWYDDFTAVLVEFCEKNGIEPTAGMDDTSGGAVGGLAKLASGFECLLPPEMRSRTPAAMVKRLQRSLARFRQGPRVAA